MRGVESMFGNIAGLSQVNKTEVLFSSTSWSGADVSINSIGLGQKLGSSGVIGISAMTMGFGEIEVTTYDNPEGGRGTYSPSLAMVRLDCAS